MRAHDHPPAGGSLAEPLGDATEALAAAWRATRAPAIATALVAVSEAYASFFDALPKRGGCFDRVLRDHDRMLSVLLGSVTRVEEVEATRRLRAIADVAGSDPRLAHHLARWSRAYVRTELPREAGASGQFARERARLLAAGPPPARPSEPASDLVRAAHAALVEGATALLASVPRRREALRLLRDVYAHPTDLPRRLVLADALLELGDPWGELITLQCARTRGETVDATREATLLAAGAQAWLGRLAKAVLVDHAGVAFEEGFPSRVVPRLDASVTGIPEWSTVRSFVSPGFRCGLRGRELPRPHARPPPRGAARHPHRRPHEDRLPRGAFSPPRRCDRDGDDAVCERRGEPLRPRAGSRDLRAAAPHRRAGLPEPARGARVPR